MPAHQSDPSLGMFSDSSIPLPATETTCCIVGGGPAGAMLALLLARKGIAVTLLEAHRDFEREYRADTLQPAILEVLENLHLADDLLRFPHTKMRKMTAFTPTGPLTLYDFSGLRTQYPYLLLLSQARFLEFLLAQAREYPSFRVLMGARVEQLVVEEGVVRGVRYRGVDGPGEVRADVTIGADGRFSKIRNLARLDLIKLASPMDLLWFKLPCGTDETHEEGARLSFGGGRFLIAFDRHDYWQVGYGFLKGGYQQLRSSGIENFQAQVEALAPWAASKIHSITDWKQVSLLSIEASRLLRWYRPGLLLIGDAAHVMTPIGGFGINLAVQDAVVAANLLGKPLLEGRLETQHLAAVQRQRELPTRFLQGYQRLILRGIQRNAGADNQPARIPLIGRLARRLPFIRNLSAYLTAYGILPPHLENGHPPDLTKRK